VKRLTLDQHLALRAFEQGYHCGADPQRERRRHTVDPKTHRHWRSGYELGRAAAERASDDYGEQLRREGNTDGEGRQGMPPAET